jgi:PHP family Zn ribbon phosphoesterase
MRFYADLHVHSKYSRATSRDLDLEHLAHWAARKGIGVVGTGDFCHPAWAAELKDKLVPAEPGLFRLREDIEKGVAATLPASCRAGVRFMLEVEISTIYKKGDKTRKVHHLIYAPDFATMDRISERLGRIGNIKSDGRPILGLDSRDLLEITLESGTRRVSRPGAYLDAVVRGARLAVRLRHDRGLLRRPRAAHLRGRDRALVRSADELARLVPRPLSPHLEFRRAFARQARPRGDRVRLRHGLLRAAPRARDRRRLCRHGRVLPEEGKYHLDGHRKCECASRRRRRSHGGRCPVCGEKVTIGVEHRVEVLADRDFGRDAARDRRRGLEPGAAAGSAVGDRGERRRIEDGRADV